MSAAAPGEPSPTQPPGAADLDGDVSDLVAMFARTFPDWTVTRTATGWWAVRGGLTREILVPDSETTVTATSAAALYVLMETANR